ncbi:HipA domain-containing protein [uncultured Clostridium sp.]|uniref:HipA domain-containing protein n=1 Tax=uncultured Clostridium sp. TaxID=59620 RepID=UPI0026F39A5A|nr:HipA domain-containing protein [uncultured Clostridium sp.]
MKKMDTFSNTNNLKINKNFDLYEIYNISLSGAVEKICVNIDKDLYMIKMDKEGEYKALSEFLASEIAKILGLKCQDVTLGYRDNRLSCGIKLFNKTFYNIHHYYSVNDSSLSSIDDDVKNLPYSLKYITDALMRYKSVNISRELLLSNFVTMTIFDCLIGNYDRHWGNWGFIGQPKKYEISPLFDNGSSLYPKLSDDDIKSVLQSKSLIHSLIYEFPKSQIRRTPKKKYLYKNLMEDLLNMGFDKEFKNFIYSFESNVDKIDELFNNKELKKMIPESRLKFLNVMLKLRFKLLIKDVYICK